MRYEIIGQTKKSPTIAVLTQKIQAEEIKKHYYNPHLESLGEDIMVCDLYLDPTKKKTSAADIKEYLDELIPNLLDSGIKIVVVTQPDYFKVLTRQTKTDSTIGDVLPTVLGDKLHAAYCPNYARVFYDPDKTKEKIKTCFDSVKRWIGGDTTSVGANIIKFRAHPRTNEEVIEWLDRLYEMQCDLTCDIEGFGLKHYDAGIGTITFCWNEHEGVSFPVDYVPVISPDGKTFGTAIRNNKLRRALKTFFKVFRHKMIYHNICYDGYVLIYQLFMDHILDQEGLLEGLDVVLKNWDCSQIITYLATNSCAGNELGLKTQAQNFAGNYAKDDIHDITLIKLPDLLEYNLIDGLATWYTYNKNYPIMVADDQLSVYETIFKPAVADVIQMQLTGMPMNMKKVKKLDKQLNQESEQLLTDMMNLKLVQSFVHELEEAVIRKKNAKLKKKQITREDLGKTKDTQVSFNPNSPDQLQQLLYSEDFLGLPVVDYTDTRQPSTGADTLEKLLNHTKDPEAIKLLNLLIEYKALAIIISTFLPAFLKAHQGNDGWHYLFGNFRLGGTASGRLSSNNPNLQNIPSSGSSPAKARLAKLIKQCFEAPPGWLFVGLDFDSLEDKISAVTTRDPMKIKVYSDGYDGHCLRAYAYFKDHMPDIDPNSVESINSIKDKYPSFRQDSKAPTFALTYQGTYITLMNNCGFSKQLAQSIETSYHEMYSVSDQWVQDRLDQACKDGYVTLAFGLRLRTPLLKQVVLGTSKTPYEAAAEGRTAGNALGQSWCMLNSRAASEFMQVVRAGKHRLDIKPCAQIHDASYYLIRDDMETLLYTNTHLSKAVSWQEDPLIQNEHISMSGKLDIFYPNWGKSLTLPNKTDEVEVRSLIKKHMEKLNDKKD